MPAIEIKGLSKTFQDRSTREPFKAVDQVSFSVSEGTFVTLLGPSGCGKTTILRMIAGFEPPTSGEIRVMGKDLTRVPPEKRGIPVVFQNYALFPHMTVFENVAYALRVKKWKKSEIEKRVKETLDLLNLVGLAKRRPDEMSGGQQQRVALARALVSQPKIMLFDEPLSNLDAKLRSQMRIELKRLQQMIGLTALYVTHDQEESMALSDVVMIMNRGRIEQIDTPENIYFKPASRFVADFIGKANFVPVEIEPSGSSYFVKVFGKKVSEVPGLPSLTKTAELMIRPEGVRLSNGKSGEFNAKVTVSSFLGSTTICEIEIEERRLLIELPAGTVKSHFEPGTSISFSLDPNRLFVL